MRLYDALQLKAKEMVCFVGAGGKTDLMLKLASECLDRGGRVLVTTTTKMFRTQLANFERIILAQDAEELLIRLGKLPSGACVIGVAAALTEESKILGLNKENLNLIFESCMFDYILVEADGARGRPFKAPGVNEPVIPSSTTCVLSVTGVDVLGRPLTEEYVHRSNIAAEITGQEIGSMVTGETVLRVVQRYALLAKKMSPGIKFIPVVNKADSDELQEIARRIALHMLPEFKRVLITSTLLSDPVREVVV